MLKAFCDVCGEPASTGTRQFDKPSNGSIGLQVVPLIGGIAAPDMHVCDECFPSLLLDAVRTFDKSAVAQRVRDNEADATEFMMEKAQIAAATQALTEKEIKLKNQMQVTTDRLFVAQEAQAKAEKRAAALQAKADVIDAQVTERVRLGIAAAKQAAADDPEYTAAVQRREAVRARGSRGAHP